MEITKEEFNSYESVRVSGLTNMFDVHKVIDLSMGVLTVDKYKAIMKDYSALCKKYGRW